MAVRTCGTRDLNADFDIDDADFQRDFLAGVAALAREAGDWRGHLPYEAIMTFRSDTATRKQYGEHVNQCEYCQELVETLNPSDSTSS